MRLAGLIPAFFCTHYILIPPFRPDNYRDGISF